MTGVQTCALPIYISDYDRLSLGQGAPGVLGAVGIAGMEDHPMALARKQFAPTPTSLATNLQRTRQTLNREAAGAGLAHEFAVTRGTDNLPSTGEAPHVQCHTEGIF